MKSKALLYILGSTALLAVSCAFIPKVIKYVSGTLYKASCKGYDDDPFKDAVIERKQ